jgi:hypothetical protein
MPSPLRHAPVAPVTPSRSVLGSVAALLPAAAARAADDGAGVASSRMSYSRFLEYLDMGRVKKVRGRRGGG